MQLALDYNDLMKIPVVNELVRQNANDTVKVRYVNPHFYLIINQSCSFHLKSS